jgi:DNA-binding XRE family transcriptional regulator
MVMTCIVRPLARCVRRDPAGLEVVARLRRARHRLGLRQLDLAVELGVSERAWRSWESGEVTAPAWVLVEVERMAGDGRRVA